MMNGKRIETERLRAESRGSAETIGGMARKYICSPVHAHNQTHSHTHTHTGRHTSMHSEVMGLQYYWSVKGETLNCRLYSWDAMYSLSHTHTHTHTAISALSTMSCSQSTQTDRRAASNQQSGTMSLMVELIGLNTL